MTKCTAIFQGLKVTGVKKDNYGGMVIFAVFNGVSASKEGKIVTLTLKVWPEYMPAVESFLRGKQLYANAIIDVVAEMRADGEYAVKSMSWGTYTQSSQPSAQTTNSVQKPVNTAEQKRKEFCASGYDLLMNGLTNV